MGTNCAPLVADLFLLCYERDFMLPLSDDNQSEVIEALEFMLSLSDNTQSEVIEAFNSTSKYMYFDYLLNIEHGQSYLPFRTSVK